jgi:hypothetical protein
MKLKYDTWASIDYFMEKYDNLINWSGFENAKAEINEVNPQLLQQHDKIVKLQEELKLELRAFKNLLEDTEVTE